MNETVRIDYLILANHVEAINGMLYISGGGWTEHYRLIQPDGKPPISHLGVGISIAIPWNETNAPHTVEMTIEDDDAREMVLHAKIGLSVGRPPQLPPGAEQHVVVAIPADIHFPHDGGYRLNLKLDGDSNTKIWNFNVHDVHQPSIPGSLPK